MKCYIPVASSLYNSDGFTVNNRDLVGYQNFALPKHETGKAIHLYDSY